MNEEVEQNEFTPVSFRISPLIIWLGVLGMGICFMPLALISTTLKTSQQLNATQIAILQETLAAPIAVSNVEQDMSNVLIASQSALKQLTDLQTTLSANWLNWAALMGTIGNYDATQLTLTHLTQEQHQLTLTGQGQNEIGVMVYVDLLRASGLFDRVTIQSLLNDANSTAVQPIAPSFPIHFTLILVVKVGMQ